MYLMYLTLHINLVYYLVHQTTLPPCPLPSALSPLTLFYIALTLPDVTLTVPHLVSDQDAPVIVWSSMSP